MATLFSPPAARQPFAPINAARLQTLTSVKNRQNALPPALASPGKRKAVDYEEDFENIDPVVFASPKRAKGHDGTETFKPSQFVLTRAPPAVPDVTLGGPVKSHLARPMRQPRSPAPKLNTAAVATLSAPAGRSPTRKRIGILHRRRTASTFTRVDPPRFAGGPTAAAPFSIADALSGTIPSYGARQGPAKVTPPLPTPLAPERQAGWFFEIHEDTHEETMTNLMEHSTCTLDISSDEETEARRRDARGKENVPPTDDVSQTQARFPAAPLASWSSDGIMDAKARARSSRRRRPIDEGAIEIDRRPLGEMAAEEFWAEGCTEQDVILVVDEDSETTSRSGPLTDAAPEPAPSSEPPCTFDFSIEAPSRSEDIPGRGRAVEDLMLRSEDSSAPTQARLFEPLEKAEEGFEVWESSSAKGDD